MSERAPKGENTKSFWVPFRSLSPATQPHFSKYENISWNPNFIPEGHRLEIDVARTNRLLQLSNIGFPLELWSYNEPCGDDFIITGTYSRISQAASVALESFAYKSRKPLNLADFFYDEESGKGIIRVNFTGIADRIEEGLKDGRNNPKFYPMYGQFVDRAIKSQMGHVINTNTGLFAQDHDDVFYSEGKSVLYGLLPLTGGLVFAILQMIVYPADYPNALRNVAVGIGGFEGVYLTSSILQLLGGLRDPEDRNQESERYQQYLLQKLKGKFDEKLQVLYPHNTTRFLILPYSVNFAWKDALVRGK